MSEEKKVNLSELRRGDILLLSPDLSDVESRLIALISGSDVSHAAMSYDKEGMVIEQSPPSVMIDTVKDRSMRETFVMRLNSNVDGVEPVMEIAQAYYDEKLPYANYAIPCVGIYLLMKRISGSSKFMQLLSQLIKKELEQLIAFLNERVNKGVPAMTCAQFVYHCYEKAGLEYKICLKDAENANLLSLVFGAIKSNGKEWQDKLVNSEVMQGVQNKSEEMSREEIIEALYKELQHKGLQCENQLESKNALTEEFIKDVYHYCKLLLKVIHAGHVDQEINEPEAVFAEMVDMSEYFITPGDLLNNADNLSYLGVLNFEG